MKLHRIAVFLIVLVAIAVGSRASAQDAPDPRKWGDNLFETLMTDGDDAFGDILRDTAAGKFNPPIVKAIVHGVNQTKEFGGALTGYEFISQEEYGPRIRKLNYATYNVNFFLSYQFMFYKGNRGWQLTSIVVTSKPNEIPWDQD
jgi:hypothetical protein